MRLKLGFFLFILFIKAVMPLNAFIPDEIALRQLHEKTERAFLAQKWPAAKKGYEAILEGVDVKRAGQFSKFALDWHTYIDLCHRLATVYHKLLLFEKGEALIADLIEKEPPIHHLVALYPLYAKFLLAQKKAGLAYRHLTTFSQWVPPEQWDKHDRSFFKGLVYMRQTQCEELLHQGSLHMSRSHYSEAIKCFETAQRGLSNKTLPPLEKSLQEALAFQLAEAYFYVKNYQKTLATLTQDTPRAHFLKSQTFLLKGMDKWALSHLQKTLQDPSLKTKAHLQMGQIHLAKGDTQEAKAHFKAIEPNKDKQSALQLAALYLFEQKPEKALAVLESLPKEARSRPLLGWAAFQRQDYSEAADFFDQAPYFQALCYLEINDLSSLKQAELLLSQMEGEAAQMALGRTLLLKERLDPTFVAHEKLGSLFNEKIDSFSLENQVQAYTLLGRANGSYAQKQTLFKLATQEKYAHTQNISLSWTYRALNDLSHGVQQKSHRERYFDQAIHGFNRALANLEGPQETVVKKGLAYALFYRNTKGTRVSCLSVLDHFLPHELEDDLVFLKASLLAKRAFEEEKSEHLILAKEAFSHIDPKSPYAARATFALATLYEKSDELEKAKTNYLLVADTFPSCELADEALYLAANVADRLGENARLIRTRLYTAYPQSRFAQEAHFCAYSLEAYLQGNSAALAHLKTFTTQFEGSLFLIPAYYFLASAKCEKNPDGAIVSFKKVLSEFEKQKDNAPLFTLFYHRALLELASLYMKQDRPLCANEVLKIVIAHFETLSTAPLRENTPFPRLYQEALLAQALCYFSQEKINQGRKVLSNMLVTFAKHEIKEGDLLARTWLEEGKIALKMNDDLLAKKCFAFAQTCGQNTLSQTEKLTLWMLQSQTHRNLKEFSQAMLKLSLVINEDVASPLRIEAMMQRAEIYATQGRHHLAMRQLQAVEKKGGDLGKKAQEKLRIDYAIY